MINNKFVHQKKKSNTNLGVNLYAVREQDPGVKLQVITIVFSPSQIGFSAIIRAWVDIS